MKLDDFPYLKTSSLQMEFLVEKLREWNLLKKKGTQESVLNEHAKSLSALWEQFLNGLLSEPASKTSPGRVGELFDAYFRIEPHRWTDLRQAYEDLACHALGETPSARGSHAFVTMTVKLIDAECWGLPKRGVVLDLNRKNISGPSFVKWMQLAILEKDVRLLERLLDWPGSVAVSQEVLTRNVVQYLWPHTWRRAIHQDLNGWPWVVRHASAEHMACWIKAGLDPNAYTTGGVPAAAFTDKPEVLAVLFEAGANPLSQMAPKNTRIQALDQLWEGWKPLLLQDYSPAQSRGSWKQGWDYLQQQLQLWPTSEIQEALKTSWLEAFLNQHIYGEEASFGQAMELLSDLARHPHVTPATALEVEGIPSTFATASMRFWLQSRWGFEGQDSPSFDAQHLKNSPGTPSGAALQALVDVAEREEGGAQSLKASGVSYKDLAEAMVHLVTHNPNPEICCDSDRFSRLMRAMFDPALDGDTGIRYDQKDLAVSIVRALPALGWVGSVESKRPLYRQALPIAQWSHRMSSQLPAAFLGGLACQFLTMCPVGVDFPSEEQALMRAWVETGLKEDSFLLRQVGKGAVGWLVKADPQMQALFNADRKKRRLDKVWSQPEEVSSKRRIRM